MRTRAERRNAKAKAKGKARKVLKAFGWGDVTPQQVGVWASTHCRPCSCNLCRSEWDGIFRFKGLKTKEV